MVSHVRRYRLVPTVVAVLPVVTLVFVLGLTAPGDLQAGKPVKSQPVAATFRCTTTAECLTSGVGDRFMDDGRGVFVGSLSTGEGAVINGNGGLSVVLRPGNEDPDRAMRMLFDTEDTTATCPRKFTDVSFVDGSLQMNILDENDELIPGGIESLAIGESNERGFGKVNFMPPVPDGYFWTVRYQPGMLRFERLGSHTWILETKGSALALLQCTTAGRGRTIIAEDGLHSLPFRITIVKPQS